MHRFDRHAPGVLLPEAPWPKEAAGLGQDDIVDAGIDERALRLRDDVGVDGARGLVHAGQPSKDKDGVSERAVVSFVFFGTGVHSRILSALREIETLGLFQRPPLGTRRKETNDLWAVFGAIRDEHRRALSGVLARVLQGQLAFVVAKQ
jgi:hypothetical protein